MAIQKNFVVKNGIEVNTDLIFADRDLNKVGIGTTIVNEKLQVKGGVGAESLNVSGIGTVPFISGTNLNYSGIGTIDGVRINSGIVTSSGVTPVVYYGEGSKLTGILTSVIVKSAGAFIGLATAIDISTNLSVIVSPSGIATITASGGPNYLYTLRSGINTTATVGQTGFTTSYSVGYVDVFINGVKLDEAEYVATDGNTVTLNNPCFGGESVSIVSYGSNPLGAGGGGTLWFQNLYGMYSLSGLSVGIGTSVPTENLTVIGNAKVSNNLSVGNSSIVFSGIGSTAYIGSGVTIRGNTGEIYATTFYGNLSGNITAGYALTAGISTYSSSSGYAFTSGISTYSSSSGYAFTSGISTSTIGGISSVTRLQVTGVSTFINGPVLIGGGTSTGTSLQVLQVTGGAYISSYVGIGTTNPTRLLHMFGDGRTNQLNVGASLNTLSTSGYGAFYAVNSSSISSGRDYRIISTGTSDAAGVGKFTIYDMVDGSDRLTIDSSGNVGLSSTNPTTKLSVTGNVNVSGVITSSGFIGGISSVTQIQVTGISTFLNGPILIGGGTSTGTAGQTLQLVGVNSSAYIGGNLGIGSTIPTSSLTVLNDSKFGGIIENVATATTYLSGAALVVEMDVRKSTYYTYTIPTGANVGIISFRNMPTPNGVPTASTVTCIFTQNAAGTGNTTNATGIGTIVNINGYENNVSVVGISTRAFVGSATTVTLSTRGTDIDFVSFFIQYTGGSNISTSSYRVYATKNGSFR